MQKIEMQSEVRSNRLHVMVTTGANRFNFKIEFCSSLTDAMIKKKCPATKVPDAIRHDHFANSTPRRKV